MSATLGELVAGLDAQITGDANTRVSELSHDSRRLGPGELFVALRGESADGHVFATQAAERGAAAVLANRDAELPELPATLAVARVTDTRAVLAEVSARLFGHPGRDLTLIGVTGTNGKSSTVRIIESLFRAADREAGSIGTISTRFGDVEEPATLTTPESCDVQRLLARMRRAGVEAVAMEVSSHALAQGRVRTLRFAAAVYTNLTQDHLDYHPDMESYHAAKALLFTPEYLAGTAILNAANLYAARLAAELRGAGKPVLTFAREDRTTDIHTTRERVTLEGSELEIVTPAGPLSARLPLPGDFQIENALAATATAIALELPLSAIHAGLEACPPVPGRLERVSAEAPAVFVDYAHTPDALDRVLGVVRPLTRGRLLCVFGCGGDRDRSKRAPMARAAARHSDLAIATSDNPRTESPQQILDDVRAGLSGEFEVIEDRATAIRHAVELADSDDTVVIAGKGHEDYQIIGRERRDFDDRVEARAALREREAGRAS